MPSMIACKTTIGFGASTKAGTNKIHGSALGSEEIKATRENLHWFADPFETPDDIDFDWKLTSEKSKE